MAEYGTSTGQSNVPFPYIEDVKAVVDYKDCINQDDDFLRRGGRRSVNQRHVIVSVSHMTISDHFHLVILRFRLRVRHYVLCTHFIGLENLQLILK